MADGEFDESRLARPLEYIAEGMELCAQQSEYHEPPVFPAWGVAHYERYLIEAGYAKPPEANHGVATGDRLVQLTQLAYLLYWSGRPRFSYVRTEFHSVPIIHDIFGNPFSPVVFKPTWGTTTAVGLATGMYESRTFTAMPILADALEDAGCDHPDILSHCREPGPHVRGCWVVDLVLGKA